MDKSFYNTPEYKEKQSQAKLGNKNHWKGGVSKYKQTYCPEHPLACKTGFVLTHRLVMERFLGRILNKDEIVHHINNNPSDNRIENLKLFTSQSEHISYHNKKRKEDW